jgi:hypothetical protein
MKCESCGGDGYHKLSCSHNPDRQPEIPMEQTKEYINRYGDKYTFSLNEQGNVDWRGSFKYCRMGYDRDSDDIIMVDPSGGPYITIDYPLEVAGIDRKVIGFKDHTTYWEILLENSDNVR